VKWEIALKLIDDIDEPPGRRSPYGDILSLPTASRPIIEAIADRQWQWPFLFHYAYCQY
jgi:hypothetical protein